MLSIIIPALNEEKYLPKLLNSIKKQDYKDYELIVADNNSKDKTRQIAKRYGCKVVKGGLPAIARNNGAKAARGDLLLFLDSDLVLANKNSLKNIIKEFNRRNLGISVLQIKALSKNPLDKMLFFVGNTFIILVQKIKPHGSAAIIVKKNIHKKMRGFNEKFRVGEDIKYIEDAAKISKFGILNEFVYVSTRRFEKFGRVRTSIFYTKSTFYQMLRMENKIKNMEYKHCS